ncbi:MAG: 2-amino-4-hydroxy-6-hydroxymethyldihydropteridine diphosphokinase [Rhodospirillales bacterium CG15_BIG_FIL_POST_REV_8_21_14_020_66_15]|nr:MAG: 2-amino-4-hydroxy-6-hydroxymethyldihydropteridine diphosphokinase [Rhodospirillales bacterium CG15_BIG_FIL_POST_REV_8_21_14_020_66_15]
MTGPIVIGVGGNLPTAGFGVPRATCGAALHVLSQQPGLEITARAGWYETAPVPVSDQPWFVNGAVRIETRLAPGDLMALLLDIETRFGRRRGARNAARILDLDLLTFGARVLSGDPEIPHPRLHTRAFALLPIRDVAPGWRHPLLNRTVEELCAELPADQEIRPLADADGYLGTEWHLPE